MKAKIVPVTLDNLGVVAEITKKYGFPRSERWIRRLLFDPNVPEGHDRDSRGALIVSDKGESVGIYCWAPCSIYLRQERKSAYIGALLGVDKKYSPWILDAIDMNRAEIAGRFAYGNDCASTVAFKFWSGLGVTWGPEEGGYLDQWIMSFGGFIYISINHLLRRLHFREANRCLHLTHILSRWLNFLPELVLRIKDVMCRGLKMHGGWRFTKEPGFSEERFKLFWERFLSANEGIISSREPATLRWKFDESIKAGTVALISAEKNGAIDGYVLLRRYESDATGATEYSMCDICAVGNDIKCLKALFEAALRYCRRRMATRMTFVGALQGKEKWMRKLFHKRIKLACNSFSYSCRDEEILRVVQENKGWFFGPYDGERCMGYGRYIDL